MGRRGTGPGQGTLPCIGTRFPAILCRAGQNMRSDLDQTLSRLDGTPTVPSLLDETVVYLSDVPGHIPPGKDGRRTHLSTVVRWKDRGVRGVRLEAVRLGGRWVTSLEALARFAARVTEVVTPLSPARPTAAARERHHEQVDRAL